MKKFTLEIDLTAEEYRKLEKLAKGNKQAMKNMARKIIINFFEE